MLLLTTEKSESTGGGLDADTGKFPPDLQIPVKTDYITIILALNRHEHQRPYNGRARSIDWLGGQDAGRVPI
jgi:hypothetical protein